MKSQSATSNREIGTTGGEPGTFMRWLRHLGGRIWPRANEKLSERPKRQARKRVFFDMP